MLTANELIDMINSLEDNNIDLVFEEVMLQIVHKQRPDVPITLYIGGNWKDQVGYPKDEEMQ